MTETVHERMVRAINEKLAAIGHQYDFVPDIVRAALSALSIQNIPVELTDGAYAAMETGDPRKVWQAIHEAIEDEGK